MTVPCLRHTQRLIQAIYETAGKEVKPNVIVNRFEQKMFDNGIKHADVQEILGDHFVGGISNNYRLVREAVDRGVPLHEIDPNANVVNDLKRIILPEEALAAARSRARCSVRQGPAEESRMTSRFSTLQNRDARAAARAPRAAPRQQSRPSSIPTTRKPASANAGSRAGQSQQPRARRARPHPPDADRGDQPRRAGAPAQG